MPAPVTSPLFASATLYTADGDAWAGDPTKVDPGAPIRAEGFEPGTLPAEWLNFMIGNHGDWAVWLEAERLRLESYIGGPAHSAPWVYETPRAVSWLMPLGNARSTANWAYDGVNWTSSGTGQIRCPIILPESSVISSVQAVVDPNGAGNTMKVGLRSRIWSSGFSVLTAPATTYGSVASGGGRQILAYTPGAPPTIQRSTDEWILDVFSDTAGDVCEALIVNALVPGPV